MSANGRFLAYVSNARGGAGLTDVYLYDVNREKRRLPAGDETRKAWTFSRR